MKIGAARIQHAIAKIGYLFICVLIPFTLFSQDQVRIEISGDQESELIVSTHRIDQIDFIQVRRLADLLEARTYYNDLAKKIVLYLGNHKVKVTAFNPFIMVDNSVFQMPIMTDYDENGIWVPLNYFIDLIDDFSPTPIAYDADNRKLSIVREGMNIAAISMDEKENGTLIRIQTLRKFDLSNLAVRLSRGWLYVDIYGGKVDTTHVIGNVSGIVQKIVPIQFEESAQLSFKLKKEVEKQDISLTAVDNEVRVSIYTNDTLPENVLVDLQRERKKWLIDKIIIDPGHGGKDPGTIGYGNLKEKDVVLDIGKRLKKLIEQKLDAEVLMTRESDRFVELRERSALANRNGGKLFISIHANGYRDRRASGVETYCLGVARTEEDRKIAEKENSVIRYEDSWAEYGNLSSENYILRAIAQSSFNKESQELAASVQKCMSNGLNAKDRGVKQAGLLVLVGTTMPKILMEVGFLSNKQEARRLRSKSYRQKVAENLFEGVKEFKESSEKSVIGSLMDNKQ